MNIEIKTFQDFRSFAKYFTEKADSINSSTSQNVSQSIIQLIHANQSLLTSSENIVDDQLRFLSSAKQITSFIHGDTREKQILKSAMKTVAFGISFFSQEEVKYIDKDIYVQSMAHSLSNDKRRRAINRYFIEKKQALEVAPFLTDVVFDNASVEYIETVLAKAENLNSLTIKSCTFKDFSFLDKIKKPELLKKLKISYCPKFNHKLPSTFHNLEELKIEKCKHFNQAFPEMPHLKYLYIEDCKSFNQSFPEELTKLQVFTLTYCLSFNKNLPEVPKIKYFKVNGCKSFKLFYQNIQTILLFLKFDVDLFKKEWDDLADEERTQLSKIVNQHFDDLVILFPDLYWSISNSFKIDYNFVSDLPFYKKALLLDEIQGLYYDYLVIPYRFKKPEYTIEELNKNHWIPYRFEQISYLNALPSIIENETNRIEGRTESIIKNELGENLDTLLWGLKSFPSAAAGLARLKNKFSHINFSKFSLEAKAELLPFLPPDQIKSYIQSFSDQEINECLQQWAAYYAQPHLDSGPAESVFINTYEILKNNPQSIDVMAKDMNVFLNLIPFKILAVFAAKNNEAIIPFIPAMNEAHIATIIPLIEDLSFLKNYPLERQNQYLSYATSYQKQVFAREPATEKHEQEKNSLETLDNNSTMEKVIDIQRDTQLKLKSFNLKIQPFIRPDGPINFLPEDCIDEIFSYLDLKSNKNCHLVNRLFSKKASKFLIESKKKPFLADMVFGKQQWEIYFGEIMEEPPIPKLSLEILKDYMLVLIPETVNGEPLTIKLFKMLTEQQKARKNRTKAQWEPVKVKISDDILAKYGDQPCGLTRWALFPKEVIRKSCNKSYKQQLKKLANYSRKRNTEYEVPHMLDAIIAIASLHVKNGNKRSNNFYSRCQEKISDANITVGSDSWSNTLNVDVSSSMRSSKSLGVGAVPKI